MARRPQIDPAAANDRLSGTFGARLGVEVVAIGDGTAECRLPIRSEHLNTNGVVHGGVIVTLADVACGAGTIAHLPDGAAGHTTAELKATTSGP